MVFVLVVVVAVVFAVLDRSLGRLSMLLLLLLSRPYDVASVSTGVGER